MPRESRQLTLHVRTATVESLSLSFFLRQRALAVRPAKQARGAPPNQLEVEKRQGQASLQIACICARLSKIETYSVGLKGVVDGRFAFPLVQVAINR
jgi:hypothetical protein